MAFSIPAHKNVAHPAGQVAGTTPVVEVIEYTEPFNTFDFISDYESGFLDNDEIIEGFQNLIDTGLAWRLQGHYGRTARDLIVAGRCVWPAGKAQPNFVKG